jgi:hypothetical protein
MRIEHFSTLASANRFQGSRMLDRGLPRTRPRDPKKRTTLLISDRARLGQNSRCVANMVGRIVVRAVGQPTHRGSCMPFNPGLCCQTWIDPRKLPARKPMPFCTSNTVRRSPTPIVQSAWGGCCRRASCNGFTSLISHQQRGCKAIISPARPGSSAGLQVGTPSASGKEDLTQTNVALGDGRWGKEPLLQPRVYKYRLVVDGEWEPDPRVSETVPNLFREMKSVLKVSGCAN